MDKYVVESPFLRELERRGHRTFRFHGDTTRYAICTRTAGSDRADANLRQDQAFRVIVDERSAGMGRLVGGREYVVRRSKVVANENG